MLAAMIPRAMRQYAHELAIRDEVDILITWKCPTIREDARDWETKRTIWFDESDCAILDKAVGYST